MIYVRKDRCSPWHFAGNCSRLPDSWDRVVIVDAGERPKSGELCNECRAKEKRGVAEPISGGEPE